MNQKPVKTYASKFLTEIAFVLRMTDRIANTGGGCVDTPQQPAFIRGSAPIMMRDKKVRMEKYILSGRYGKQACGTF
ncbi:MAG TPA: hypothetical protein DDY31_16730 [Lachnospiraceae bacterium]|nr:hypothetical protein [Lachnospiraceae bacterium]HBI62824.1 hypothetical protein [Lachnospiraceae bacterium]